MTFHVVRPHKVTQEVSVTVNKKRAEGRALRYTINRGLEELNKSLKMSMGKSSWWGRRKRESELSGKPKKKGFQGQP